MAVTASAASGLNVQLGATTAIFIAASFAQGRAPAKALIAYSRSNRSIGNVNQGLRQKS
jgi:hypothetical protein